MSKSVKINNATYENVPKVEIPLAAGEGNAVFYDVSDSTIDASHVLTGKLAYGANGPVTGTMVNNGAQTEYIAKLADSVKIKAGYHDGTGSVSIAAAEKAKIIAGNIKAGTTILGVDSFNR